MAKSTRPPIKQDAIVDELRSRILDGRLQPGDRLPTRAEIEVQFSASSVTVQRAFNRLSSEGFTEARGTQGTFVHTSPPHLSRFALLFPSGRNDGNWVHFWNVMANVAPSLEEELGIDIQIRTRIDASIRSADLDAVVADCLSHRLAGLIFASPTFLVSDTPLTDEPGIPRVVISSNVLDNKDFYCVSPGGDPPFGARALDHLAGLGCKRVAILSTPGRANELSAYHAELQKRRSRMKPEWYQLVHQGTPAAAANIAHLLFSRDLTDRADGLIITDDNLTEHACAGLLRAGVRVPDDLQIVAHCNFPPPTPSVLPVARLGYDIPRLLRTCIEVIQAVRRGEEADRLTWIPTQFEWELEGNEALREQEVQSRASAG